MESRSKSGQVINELLWTLILLFGLISMGLGLSQHSDKAQQRNRFGQEVKNYAR